MDKAVSAADANRRFLELLRTVKNGRSVIVTSHGKPVAKITPVVEDEQIAAGARSVLLVRLRREAVKNAGRWMRDKVLESIQQLPPAAILLPVQTLGELFNVLVRKAKRLSAEAVLS